MAKDFFLHQYRLDAFLLFPSKLVAQAVRMIFIYVSSLSCLTIPAHCTAQQSQELGENKGSHLRKKKSSFRFLALSVF